MTAIASPDQSTPLSFATRTIHCLPDEQTGAVVHPLSLSTTFAYEMPTKPGQFLESLFSSQQSIHTLPPLSSCSGKFEVSSRPSPAARPFELTFRRVYPFLQYVRDSNPNRNQLEEVLGSLEGGQPAICYSSGSAGTAAAIQMLGSGAHVLLMEDV